MNWWMLAGGLMALISAAGHAVARLNMFYRPIKSAIASELHASVLTGMWHLITIRFSLSAIALLVLGIYGRGSAVAWFIGAICRLCGALSRHLAASRWSSKTFQWIPFGVTAILAAVGAATAL